VEERRKGGIFFGPFKMFKKSTPGAHPVPFLIPMRHCWAVVQYYLTNAA